MKPECVVLLVDDNEDARDAVAHILKTRAGIDRVVCVDDGLAALAELRGGLRPCVIVLDLQTPRMNGREFRAAQVAEPALCDIPVVLCSGWYDVETAAAEMGLPSGHGLTKPLAFEPLVELVQQHCASGGESR